MAKQKCGTCRFYEEAGFAGSGWCHHPQRVKTTGALVMVRRNELACRDGWDQNLWEAAGPEDSAPHGELAPAAERTLPVESHGHARSREQRPRLAGEDVLLSEARILSEGPSSWEQTPKPFPMAGFDPRTAIFRAREAYRERSRAKAAAVRKESAAEALSDADVFVGGPTGEQDRPTMSLDRHMPGGSSIPGARGSRDPSERKPVGSIAVSAVESVDNVPFSVRPEEAGLSHGETPRELGISPPSTPVESPMQHVYQALTMERPAMAPTPRDSGRRFETFADEEVEDPPTKREKPAALPIWFRTDLPRVCRSCRDYRPAADGQRGWCGNTWAFTHSRLVGADDGVPCQSAIGDWWVPADDVWLVAADVSAHGRATPLLDRQIGVDIAKRRRS